MNLLRIIDNGCRANLLFCQLCSHLKLALYKVVRNLPIAVLAEPV